MPKLDSRRKQRTKQTAYEVELLRDTADFVALACTAFGTLMPNAREVARLAPKWRLTNYHDFSFYYESCRGAIGPNVLKVWHHPGKRFRAAMPMVLSLEWQGEINSLTHPRVRDPDKAWVRALRQLTRSWKKGGEGPSSASKGAAIFPEGLTIRRHYLT